jgi:hypothetical protein
MSLQLIAIDGTALDLMPNAQIQMNLKNTALNEAILEGSFSYSFAIPLSDKNLIYFGYPSEISSLAGYQSEFNNFKLKSGLVEIICKLVVRSVQPGALNINLYSSTAYLADLLRETKLTDLPTQTIDIQQEFWYIKSRFTIDPGTPLSLASGTIKWALTGGGFELYQYAVPIESTAAEIVKAFATKINAYNPILPWSSSTTYQYEELALDTATDKVYISIDDPNTNHDLSDTLWWDFLCNKADWNALRASNGTTYWYLYDEFNALKREKAFAIDEYLVIYDPLKGTAGRILDVNTLNDAADTTDAGYFSLFEYAAYGINVWQDNYTALAGYMTAKVKADGANPDFTFFPIHNPNFSPSQDYCGIVNYWKDGTFRGNLLREKPYQYAFSAQVNFIYVLEKIHDFLDLEADGAEVLGDEFLNALYLLNNFSNDRNIRGFDAGGYYYIDAGANIINLSKNLPTISLADFLNGARGYLYFGIWIDWFTGRIVYRNLKSIISDFANAIDLTASISEFREITYTDPDGFDIQYTHDGGDAFISDQVKDIEDDSFVILAPVATRASLLASPVENNLCLVIDEDQYYLAVLLFENVIEWQSYSKNLFGVKTGNAKTDYQPKAATPMMYSGHDFARGPKEVPPVFVRSTEITYREGDVVQDSDGDFYTCTAEHADKAITNTSYWSPGPDQYRWLLPMTAQARNSRNFKEKSGCTLRFLAYKGLLQNPYSADPLDKYPQATNDLGSDGSLKIDGTYGLYQERGKEWIEFLSTTKKAIATIPMDEALLGSIKPWSMFKVSNQFYLMGEIKVSFPLNSAPAEITLYSIKNGN